MVIKSINKKKERRKAAQAPINGKTQDMDFIILFLLSCPFLSLAAFPRPSFSSDFLPS